MRTMLTAAFALGISAVGALAQDSTNAASATDWTGQLTLYGWVPGIKGAQERPDGDPLIDLD